MSICIGRPAEVELMATTEGLAVIDTADLSQHGLERRRHQSGDHQRAASKVIPAACTAQELPAAVTVKNFIDVDRTTLWMVTTAHGTACAEDSPRHRPSTQHFSTWPRSTPISTCREPLDIGDEKKNVVEHRINYSFS